MIQQIVILATVLNISVQRTNNFPTHIFPKPNQTKQKHSLLYIMLYIDE